MIKVIIVDDEKKACTNLKNLLTEYTGKEINVAGMAYSSKEAEELIGKYNPDAVFLDIEMPHENAFHFLDRMSPINFEVIFVTAYDDYAVRAFRLNAIDYLLKPISIHELQTAVQKLNDKLRYNTIIRKRNTSFSEISDMVFNKAKQHKITLKDNTTTEVVDFKDIFFIEAQSSYSKILFLKDKALKEMTTSNPLSDYEELLPDDIFYRVHRSYLVNCARIKKILNDGSNQIVVEGNRTLPVSRRRLASLLDFLATNDYV
jgi:two-component system LytT family response regulator